MFIGATNRKQDLDAALRSRFSTTVTFGLPDHISRCVIGSLGLHMLTSVVDRCKPNLHSCAALLSITGACPSSHSFAALLCTGAG